MSDSDKGFVVTDDGKLQETDEEDVKFEEDLTFDE
jgi:hypothetical protein